MLRYSFTLCLLCLVLLGSPDSASAGQNGERINPAQQEFSRKYVAALHSQDARRVMELLHPKVLSCINDSNRDFFDYLVAKDLKNPPQPGYTIAFSPTNSDTARAGLPATLFTYTVEPTQQLQLDWKHGANASTTMIRALAMEGSRWLLVFPCPTAEGMKVFHEQLARRQQQQELTQKLAAEIKEPLRAELKDLLKQGRKIDAAKKYQAATGADLTTAVQVVNVLDSSSR